MTIALILLVALAISSGTVLLLDRQSKGLKRLEQENKELRNGMTQITHTIQIHSDLEPYLADMIKLELDKINKRKRT